MLVECPSNAASPTINIRRDQSSHARPPDCCAGWDTNIRWDQTTRANGRHSITTGRVEPRLVKTDCSHASPKGQHRYLFRGVTDNLRTGASGLRCLRYHAGHIKDSCTIDQSKRRGSTQHLERILDDWGDWDANNLAPSSENLSVGVKPKGWELSGLSETRPRSHNHSPDHRISTMSKER